MLTIRITPLPLYKGADAYAFRITYIFGGRELSTEAVMTTGMPDSEFEVMFEIAKRQIKDALPAMRLGSPTLFSAALWRAAKTLQASLNDLVPPIHKEDE